MSVQSFFRQEVVDNDKYCIVSLTMTMYITNSDLSRQPIWPSRFAPSVDVDNDCNDIEFTNGGE